MAIYPKPARYKVLADSYINDALYPASTDEREVFVDYDGHPGTALAPTDAEGERRKRAYFAAKRLTPEQAGEQKRRLTEGAYDPGVLGLSADAPRPPNVLGDTPISPPQPVAIPADWQTYNAGSRVLLAAKLGAPDTVNTAPLANDFIEAEIARRMAAGAG